MAHARGQLLEMARQAAWNAVRAIEQPQLGEPTITQIRTACRNARLLADICDRLSLDDLLDDLEGDFEDDLEDQWTRTGWVLPPQD